MKFILAFFISALIWSSCKFNTYRIGDSSNISSELLAEMRDLDTRLLGAIGRGDMVEIKTFLSDSLIASSDSKDLEDFMMSLSSMVKQNKYSYVEQFDVNNSGSEVNTILSIPKEEATIEIVALNAHSFVSLLLSDKIYAGERPMITFVYGQYPEGWKLNIIHSNPYSFVDLNAKAYFAKAKEAYEQGFLIDAALYIDKCESLRHPSLQWVYDQDSEISSLIEVISAAVEEDFSFPFTVDIASQPNMLGVQLAADSIGTFPFILYETKLDINDAVILTVENEELHRKIGQIFKGMEQKERIFYRAYEKGNESNTYGFMKTKD